MEQTMERILNACSRLAAQARQIERGERAGDLDQLADQLEQLSPIPDRAAWAWLDDSGRADTKVPVYR